MNGFYRFSGFSVDRRGRNLLYITFPVHAVTLLTQCQLFLFFPFSDPASIGVFIYAPARFIWPHQDLEYEIPLHRIKPAITSPISNLAG